MSVQDIEFKHFIQNYNLGCVFAIGTYSTVKYAKSIVKEQDDPELEYAIKKTTRYKIMPNNPVEMEIDILQSIQHENIVKMVDFHISRKHAYIVMDFIKGRNLQYYVEWNFRFAKDQLARIMYDLSAALTYLHRYGIIHRDVNPRNLIVEVDANSKVKYLKLVDFGCAVFDDRTSLLFQGVVQFCAPELLHADPYGCNVDVWSAGVVLCYLIFGLEICHFNFAIKELDFNRFDSTCIPIWFNKAPLLKRLIQGMLDKNPRIRYSALDVLTDPWLTIYNLH